MSQKNSNRIKKKRNFLQTCRSLHGWLGIFVVPWVILIGATGFYLNHWRAIAPVLFPPEFSESGFDRVQPPVPITRADARLLGETVWPGEPIKKIWEKDYHGRPSFFIRKHSGLAILSIPTGHYYLKTRYERRTFSPDGRELHSKTYWGTIFKDMHRAGWLNGTLGTWIADAVSLAMVAFGITGSLMWTLPRVKRALRRR